MWTCGGEEDCRLPWNHCYRTRMDPDASHSHTRGQVQGVGVARRYRNEGLRLGFKQSTLYHTKIVCVEEECVWRPLASLLFYRSL